MEKPKILCYDLDNEAVQALTKLTRRLGIAITPVSPEDYGMPIAAVASGITAAKNPLVNQRLPEPMLIFVSVSDAMLDALLFAMREKGIKISLKAVLTPHNALWDAVTLCRELCAEREALKK